MLKLSLTLILFTFPLFSQSVENDVETYLKEGHKLEKQEAYEDALLIWADAFSTLEEPSPAIGREFVRMATEQNLRDYYELASMVYFWGLTAEKFESTTDLLHSELIMMEPIMTDEEFSSVHTFFENKDPALYKELEHFWNRLNPTPGTEHNARMVEHWERVTYAKEHFTRNIKEPLNTDDRGISYIKYGQPDRLHKGRLEVTRGQAASLSTMLDPVADAQFMANIIMDFGLNPEYELWIYNQPNPEMKFNLFKLFGEHPTRGFGLVDQVEDFIPSRAFSFDSNRYRIQSLTERATTAGVNLSPGMIYLWYFYEKLASMEPYFANQFSNITAEWESAEMHLNSRESGQNPTSGKYAGQLQIQRNQIAALRDLNLAPVEFSTHEKNLPTIPVEVFQYRILDEQNKPAYATFIESKPGQAFLIDFGYNEDRMDQAGTAEAQELFNHYQLFHALQLLSENEEIITQLRQGTDLLIDFKEDEPSNSVFVIPYISENTIQILSAELHNQHPESERRVESSFTPTLRGLGKVKLNQPEPLNPDPEYFEVSDLIIGFQLQDNPPPNAFLPFVVANNRAIPSNEELVVRFETYNLVQGGDGFAEFELDYKITLVRGSFFSRSQKEEFSLTLNYEIMANRFTENIEIQTADLEPGSYNLEMIFTDLKSNQRVERTVEFKISEL